MLLHFFLLYISQMRQLSLRVRYLPRVIQAKAVGMHETASPMPGPLALAAKNSEATEEPFVERERDEPAICSRRVPER